MKILSKLQEYVKNLLDKEQTVIAFTSQGKARTSAQHKKELDETIAEVDKGAIISQEQMEVDLDS